MLHFELDYPADAFPLVLELRNERGETVDRLDGLGSDVVYQGANLLPIIPARSGRYSARIIFSNPAYPPLVMPFELVPPVEHR